MIVWVLGYVLVALAFIFWDAYIGFGFEFPDIEDGPNALLAGIFWPIGLPIVMVIICSQLLERAKDNRKERAREKQRLRIAAEKEQEAILKQIEEEMQHVEAKDENTTKHARILPGSSSRYSKS